MEQATIALLTDFGAGDVFVGAMKGVIAQIAPGARLIDLTHDIPPGDVRAGALRLWQARPYMPAHTVYLAVVDPGVGTSRRALAVSTEGFACVGPDNGLFTYMLGRSGGAHAVEIRSQASRAAAASVTFHGRDIFAPAAARLAAGSALTDLGAEATGLTHIPYPRLELVGGAGKHVAGVRGEVLFSDHFGNIITSIGVLGYAREELVLQPWVPNCSPAVLPAAGLRARLQNGPDIPFARTYEDVADGLPLAYVGSDGLLEIGVNKGRAADLLPSAPGVEVALLP
jgi:S-adenosyl-L-methionine hydrolase (adenosine-forming)